MIERIVRSSSEVREVYNAITNFFTNLRSDIGKISEFEAFVNDEEPKKTTKAPNRLSIISPDDILPPADPEALRDSILKGENEYPKPENAPIFLR